MCYFYTLDEITGSDILELRKGDDVSTKKFTLHDSLYIVDNAFYFLLEAIIQRVVPSFDMFDDTVITEEQWNAIMQTCNKETEEVKEVITAINDWAREVFCWHDSFIIMGV